jgi:hypothetical protein
VDYHIQPYPKIDNNKLSPTFETILKIISGLNIDISDLSTSIENKTPPTRQVFTRKGKRNFIKKSLFFYKDTSDKNKQLMQLHHTTSPIFQ